MKKILQKKWPIVILFILLISYIEYFKNENQYQLISLHNVTKLIKWNFEVGRNQLINHMLYNFKPKDKQ